MSIIRQDATTREWVILAPGRGRRPHEVTPSRVLRDPDFNCIIHTAPLEDEARPYYLWHLRIVPRLTTLAGFELGSGMWITTMLPEESAAMMRDALQSDQRGER